jgi:ribose transport system permease protein
MNLDGFKRSLGRFFSRYGMLGVLLLLCLYYSWATITQYEPRGAEAGRQIARQIAQTPGATALVVARATEEGTQFVRAFEMEAQEKGIQIVGIVQGDPRAARLELEKLAEAGQRIRFIAATPEASGWPVLRNVADRFPPLGSPELAVPQSYKWPAFLTRQNLVNVANQITVVAILAIGMTVVIITAGIDLSVGSLIALSAVLVTILIRDLGGGVDATAASLVACSVAGVVACALVGAFTGLMIAGFKIPPFIATLAVMQVASGLAFIFARGGSIYEVPDSFTWLGRGVSVLGIPNAVMLMMILYLAAHVMMTRTTLGRRLYAVGGNPEAARLSGVNVGAVLLFAYAFSGAMAGLGGVLMASQLKSGAPVYGMTYELYVIAAVVVGGASLSGGEGRIFGTLIGALIMGVIQNGMNLTGVESYSQKVVLGLVILGAVLLDMLKKRDWRALFRKQFSPALERRSDLGGAGR